MNVDKILLEWKKKQFHPVYWLEGEEEFYIDLLTEAAETSILSEAEAGFNLSVFYGKDANWADVVNACKRYPMFSDRQVVLLKEAQQMKDLDKLEQYILNPLPSTVLIVAHKDKKVDGRSKLAKILKDKATLISTKKLKENELPGWTQQLIEKKGFMPTQKAIQLLVDHIGNDLSRIANEVDKLILNLGTRTSITEDDVEEYVGISKEYNVFELQRAVGLRNFSKALQIVQYFESNPKAAPIQMVLPALYSYFSKVFMLFGVKGDDKTISEQTGINSWFLRDYKSTASIYGFEGIQSTLVLLHHYNLRSLGVHDAGTEDASLMKELLYKVMLNAA
ncbi:MAG: DNA polymerase III subunit delta [Lacibacter sp.]|jgi:DNA polymerase-3 subunit delta